MQMKNIATPHFMKTVIVLLCLAVSRIVGQIDQPPSSTTAKIGDTITLICQVSNPDEPTQWWEYISSPVGNKIFTSTAGIIGDPEKYDIEGTYNLIIKNLEFTDGGLYGCITDSMQGPARADLVVIEEPQAISGELIEGETTLVSCNTRYQSPIHDEMDPLHIPKTEGYIHADNIVTDFVTIKAPEYYAVKIDMNYTGMISDNGRNLTCRVYTEEPFYEDYGMLPMDVKYEVRDIDLTPKNPYYYVGEYINCTASGNPYPDFKWVAIYSPGARPVTGQTLTIEMNMIGPNEWKCQATNTVKEIVDIEMTIEFDVQEDDTGGGGEEVISPTEGYVIALAVIIPLAIIIVLVIIGVLFWKRRMAPSKKPPESIEDTSRNKPSSVNPTFQEESFQEDDINGFYPGYSNIDSVPKNPNEVPYGHNQQGLNNPFYPTHNQPMTGTAPLPYQQRTSTAPVPMPRNLAGSESPPGYADLGIKQFPGSAYPSPLNHDLSSSKNSLNQQKQGYGYGVNTNPNPYGSHPGLDNMGYNRSNSRLVADASGAHDRSMTSSVGHPETTI